jgi:hypothetical protein
MLAGHEPVGDEADRVAIARVVGTDRFGGQPFRRRDLDRRRADHRVNERIGAKLDRVVADDELVVRDRAGKQRRLLARARGLGQRGDHRDRARPFDRTRRRGEPAIEIRTAATEKRDVVAVGRNEAADAGPTELHEALRDALRARRQHPSLAVGVGEPSSAAEVRESVCHVTTTATPREARRRRAPSPRTGRPR